MPTGVQGGREPEKSIYYHPTFPQSFVSLPQIGPFQLLHRQAVFPPNWVIEPVKE